MKKYADLSSHIQSGSMSFTHNFLNYADEFHQPAPKLSDFVLNLGDMLLVDLV